MITTIAVIIVLVINLLKIYLFFDGEKIFAQISAGVMLLDLSSNRFLHFEETIGKFSCVRSRLFFMREISFLINPEPMKIP